ncbi:MAG: hypothetical protein JOZ65_13295, partial [Chloroflexi bacterium]|nr:hypothetical protein [Chloroflexota bacterium]
MNIFDEGYVIEGAARILAGQVPYRDYLLAYGPAQFYALAMLFTVSGQSLSAERVYDAAIQAAIVVVMFLTVARTTRSRVAALFASVLALVSFILTGLYGYPLLPALGLALVAASCQVNFFQKLRPAFAYLSGVFIGLAGLFRQDLGVLLVVATIAAGALLTWVLSRSDGCVVRRSLARGAGAWALGVATPVIPALAVLAILAGPVPLIDDLILYPLTGISEVRGLPLPALAPFPAAEFTDGYSFGTYMEFTLAPWVILYGSVAAFAISVAAAVRRLLVHGLVPGELAVWA